MDNLILSPIPFTELIEAVRSVVKDEIAADQQKQLDEKLLSPKEVCKLFQPNISLVTLSSWTKQGLLQDHRISSRVYYKYSEVMTALKTLKRYKKSQ